MKQSLSWEIFDRKLYGEKWKDNKGYAAIILNAVRLMTITSPLQKIEMRKQWVRHITLEVAKMSRIFVYVDKNKYFSCIFPFHVISANNTITVQYNSITINSILLSEASSLLNDISNSTFYNLYKDGDEDTSYSDEAFCIVEKLLTTEPCYVRYDNDAQGEKGHRHPRIHFDVNMSKAGTFKVGLRESMSSDMFVNVFDKEKDCLYLVEHSKFNGGFIKNKRIQRKGKMKGKK